MISRSFGLNIGGAIGLALYLSQAISVAFYVIAFTVACRDLLLWVDMAHGVTLTRCGSTSDGHTTMMVGKGANLGKGPYIVVVLLLSVGLVLLGEWAREPNLSPFATIPDVLTTASGETVSRFSFFEVFTFISRIHGDYEAWAGGDLKDPRSAFQRHHLGHRGGHCLHRRGHQVVVEAPLKPWWRTSCTWKTSPFGVPSFPLIGRCCNELGLGSVMVAPRTLQAIAADKSFRPACRPG